MGKCAVNEKEISLKERVPLKREMHAYLFCSSRRKWLTNVNKCRKKDSSHLWLCRKPHVFLFIMDLFFFFFPEAPSSALLSPFQSGWCHDCSKERTQLRQIWIFFSNDKDILALSLWSIILFYVTGSHLNQITTKGIKMSLFPANYRAWQNLSRNVGWTRWN